MDDSKRGEATFAVVKPFPYPLTNREFVVRDVFKVDASGGVVEIAIESVDVKVDYGSSLSMTRGFVRGMWRLENLPERTAGLKQCRCTMYQYVDAAGIIPVR